MPLILFVDLTEIALFRNSDETSGDRDLMIGSQIGPGRVTDFANFLWESVRQRSEGRVMSRKPKKKCRIAANVKPEARF
jgi:hypothetical protein